MQQGYTPPDFDEARFRDAPDARFVPAPADGVLPDDFFATSNLPIYVKIDGSWKLPRFPRMDGVIIQEAEGLRVVEGRYVRQGQLVAVGHAEDGSEGIFVNFTGFLSASNATGEFQFMSSEVSREKPVDYALMADMLRAEKARGGHIVWVVGPAVLHSRGRDVVTWFIQNGYVGAMLGGNAVAVHDIEQALLGTTLGMDRSGRPVTGGHAFHMRAINQVARAGSIREAVSQGVLTQGIMHACVTHDVPFVLAGSIRDDGPLPDTITNTTQAQEMMREHATRATMTIMIATALHSIAFGNMLPAYVVNADDSLRPLTTIAVDTSEFVVSKLKDRGTHQAFGVITNAQDFLHVLRYFVEHDPVDTAQSTKPPLPAAQHAAATGTRRGGAA
jgi:lysine-ketoglutarate reductase/saccharopine dehydrogenase-like protein (TIGR00300 family)